MYRFNKVVLLIGKVLQHLNTSHVSVQYFTIKNGLEAYSDLNTSHVSVQSKEEML